MAKFLSFIIILGFLSVLFSQTIPGIVINKLKDPAFNQRYNWRWVDGTTLEITDKYTGMKKMYDISDHGSLEEAMMKSDQVIDLANVDTTLYNWKFKRIMNLPVGSYGGYPMVIGDFNNNNKTDIAGGKIHNHIATCAIVEMNDDTTFVLRKIFPGHNEIVLSFTDVDHDGLGELNIKYFKIFKNYESIADSTYPDILKFVYNLWYGVVAAEKFYDLDKDGWMDIFYPGDDLLPPNGQKLYVAEYDSSMNNFVKKFRYVPEDWDTYGSSIGDFDGDGFTEFFTASVHGRVYGFENSGNDSYQVVYEDTISAPNAYLDCATDDIDRNGKPEFFIGGTAFYQGIPATRIYWFEADGNNHYLKKRSLFLLNSGFFGIHELYGIDVNMDGIEDLVFAFPLKIVILTWNPRGFFELFFLDIIEQNKKQIEGINIYDTFRSNMPDLYVCLGNNSRFYVNNFLTGIQTSSSETIGSFKIFPNYPNPFNTSTIIEFFVSNRTDINVTIYDITGKEVIKLIKNTSFMPGKHKVVWNGTNKEGKEVSSGVYLTEMKTGSFREVRKILLIR